MNTSGMVYLVGAGPGDPKLLTLRGLEVLQRADVIVYDRLVNERLLDHARADAECIFAGKSSRPFGQVGDHAMSQEEIEELLIARAQEGKCVCRLKGGDPFIFGRGGEEAEALVRAGITFEIVPGVTSGTAAPAYAGIPLTHRDLASSVVFMTGHEDPAKEAPAIAWDKLATGADTLVVFMGIEKLMPLTDAIMRYGRDSATPAAVIRWGTTGEQTVVVGALGSIAAKCEDANIRPPALLVIGEVVRLREQLRWFDNRPLFGRQVVVTRARAQSEEFVAKLEALGAEVIEFPVIRIEALDDYGLLDAALADLEEYDWVIFTSANGVDFFARRLMALGLNASVLQERQVCAIGPATAERLSELGCAPVFVPQQFVAESVVAGLAQFGMHGKRVLLARALEAREVLPEALTAMGARVDVVPAYRTVLADSNPALLRSRLRAGRPAFITFTSSSTVCNFAQLVGAELLAQLRDRLVIASIGPITTETARSLGWRVDLEAKQYDMNGLLDAMLAYCAGGADRE